MWRCILKLLWLGVPVALVFLGVLSSVGVPGTVARVPPNKGTLYVTQLDIRASSTAAGGRANFVGNNKVLRPLDLALGLFTTIISHLGVADDILCGPDGKLYVTDSNPFGSRIIYRFNQDGAGRTIIAQWNGLEDLLPDGIALSSSGDLYFGTHSTTTIPQQGLWRIPGVLQVGREFNAPEQILQGSNYKYNVTPQGFLTTGPFEGDLIIFADGQVLYYVWPNPTIRLL